MGKPLTVEQLINVSPKYLKPRITGSLVNSINSMVTEPDVRDTFRQNILGYTSVMREGRFHINYYIDAVKYVSYKLCGCTNIVAYTRTFPERYQRYTEKGISQRNMASVITSYNRNKLVNLIFEQTLVPTHVLNADLYQKAINVQAELMMTAKSEKVRTDAANSLMVQLKPPEVKKIELDVGLTQDKTISDLRKTTMELVAMQREMIKTGTMPVLKIAESKLLLDNNSGEIIDE